MAQILEYGLATIDLVPNVAVVQQQLRSSPYWSIRQLVCQTEQDRVVVRGTVPSFYLKQVAEWLVCKAVGAECVESEIHVPGDPAAVTAETTTRLASQFYPRQFELKE